MNIRCRHPVVRTNPLIFGGKGTRPGHLPCINTRVIILSISVADSSWVPEPLSWVCLCIGYVFSVAKIYSILQMEKLCIECSGMCGGGDIWVLVCLDTCRLGTFPVCVCPSVCSAICTSHNDTTGIIKNWVKFKAYKKMYRICIQFKGLYT